MGWERGTAIEDLVKRTGTQARDEVAGLNYLCDNGKTRSPATPSTATTSSASPACSTRSPRTCTSWAARSPSSSTPGTATARTLLDQPRYNFDDQSTHPFPEPIPLAAGDLLANFTSYGAQDIVDLAAALQDPAHPNEINPSYLTNGTPNPTYHDIVAQTIADAASRFPPEARL